MTRLATPQRSVEETLWLFCMNVLGLRREHENGREKLFSEATLLCWFWCFKVKVYWRFFLASQC